MPAPIVAFVYNRPVHTRRMLESLQKNVLAQQSELYIFADGAKPQAKDTEKKAIVETRQVIRSQNWCQTVHICESEVNRGLADSIVSGITEMVEKFGKVIVLEDDLQLQPGFLQFMNDALDLYENTPEVMHVSGYIFPIQTNIIETDTFFYNQASSWGWATWKRAWTFFESNPVVLMEKIEAIPDGISQFNIDNGFDFFNTLRENAEGKKKTWAVKWQASIFLQKGLCLHPKKTLLNNIGNDGSGTHKGFTNKYFNPNVADFLTVKPIELTESAEARRFMKEYYSSNMPKKSLIPLSLKQKIADLLPQKLKNYLFSLLTYKR